MICRSGVGGLDAMTLPSHGEEALALFCHEEEAELFLGFLEPGNHENGWHIRESRRGEIASMLCGPFANAKRVVLDPLPSMISEGTLALVSMDRASFVARLLARGDAGGWPSQGKRVDASIPQRRSRGGLSALRWLDRPGRDHEHPAEGTIAESG